MARSRRPRQLPRSRGEHADPRTAPSATPESSAVPSAPGPTPPGGHAAAAADEFVARAEPCDEQPSDSTCDSSGAENDGDLWILVSFRHAQPSDTIGVEVMNSSGAVVDQGSTIALSFCGTQHRLRRLHVFPVRRLRAGDYERRATRNGEPGRNDRVHGRVSAQRCSRSRRLATVGDGGGKGAERLQHAPMGGGGVTSETSYAGATSTTSIPTSSTAPPPGGRRGAARGSASRRAPAFRSRRHPRIDDVDVDRQVDDLRPVEGLGDRVGDDRLGARAPRSRS